MKRRVMLPSIIVVFILILLYGCGPAVTFDRPQPEHGRRLRTFPARIQGQYLAKDKTSVLAVSEHAVVRIYDFDYKEHKDSLGTTFKIAGDSLIDVHSDHKERIQITGDSIVRHAHWTDSLFYIAAGNILQKFKGHYFLNSRYSDNVWGVQRLTLAEDVLILGNISGQDDINKLRAITETTEDTLSTHFTMTGRQFKKFIKEGGFEEQEVFTRISR